MRTCGAGPRAGPSGSCRRACREALWKRLKSSRLFLRGAPTGVALARADASAPAIIAKHAADCVTVTGTPAELTLWSMGRASAANVTFEGPDDAIARLRAWRR